ncbi:flagella basal body P-ring formation protein FlgA [Sphingomonas hankookensis]|uniref:flagella basal body P-ring formation protein FlgA n=1 Tax=Sphingomonas hankookensis TaxID=563996 RepID=UPI001F5935BD|nr:flagella basal body P-ring formation protein FlgA [Sphingomonas hankookensis]
MIRHSLFAALLIASPATAQTFQSTTQLDEAVVQFTGASIGMDGGAQMPVDPRLKLARCAMPQFGWLSDRQDAVVISCMGPAWKVYVPVRRMTRTVPERAVPTPIAAAPVKAEPVIRRGDPIMVEAGAPGFSITRDGVAMGDAPVGGRLMVKVDPAKPPIQAVALESGRAALPGFGR